MHKSWKDGSNRKNKYDKGYEAVSTIFPCERSVQTVELSRILRHTKFSMSLSLADKAETQLHHTQTSYLSRKILLII